MKRWSIFILCLGLTGCGGCGDIKKKVGLEEDPEVTKQRLADEKQRLAEEKVLKAQQLKDADQLVQQVADQLQNNADNGFPRYESLELDPWGNSLAVEYRQEWLNEVAVIRSAGPDGKMNTLDDLTRTRKTRNPSNVLSGIGWQGWLIIAWVGLGFLALLFSAGIKQRRKSHGKPQQEHPVIFAIAVMIFAPLMFLVLGLQLVGNVLGATGSFFEGLGFDFDWD